MIAVRSRILSISSLEKHSALTKVLHDVLVLQFLQKFNLSFKGLNHIPFLLLIASVTRGKLHLLNGHKQTGLRVHAKENGAERALADKSSLDPLYHTASCDQSR